MTVDIFLNVSNFAAKTELERTELFAFYLIQVNQQSTFTLKEVAEFFNTHGFSRPNSSRLAEKLRKSKSFVKATGEGNYQLHKLKVESLRREFPDIDSKSEEIITEDKILPEGLYLRTRGYIENLAKQINASYDHNIFDGCAILMRRLVEVLLFLTYEHLNRLNEIEDTSGTLKNLSTIINHTLSDSVIPSLCRDSRELLDQLRELGNSSAHRITYNAKKGDINPIRQKFRVLVEELLYSSGIKK